MMVLPWCFYCGLWLTITCARICLGEVVVSLDVAEGVPVGTLIGTIGRSPGVPGPPYLIVPLSGSDPDADLIINQKTGEIRTKSVLDRERSRSYELSAIPLNGEGIRVTIQVLDMNDNRPTFEPDVVDIDVPENIPRGTRRKLPPALDLDTGEFGTKDYAIVSGNTDEAFELAWNVESPSLDIMVKGSLDRERQDRYSLTIVARDGGSPPQSGTLKVNIAVQDLNDSPPLFAKQRYFTSVSSDLPVGGSVMTVKATDADVGDNSKISYFINRRQSDKDENFRIDAQTGLITLAKKLDFERHSVHEIVVVARDAGEVPQETSAFITVRLSGASAAAAGQSAPEPQDASSNDHDPQFVSGPYSAQILESAEPGSFVAKISAVDPDSGDSGRVTYSLRYDDSGAKTYSDWFDIEAQSGLITTQSYIDCDLESDPLVRVVATDHGDPARSSEALLKVSIKDVNENKPLFESSFYSIQLGENHTAGHCFLTLKAYDADCGSNGVVRYSLQDGSSDAFRIDNSNGKLCLAQQLDHEARQVHNVVVFATDKGGLSTSTLVKVSVTDFNDNVPEFSPTAYQATIPASLPVGAPVVKVKAFDRDAGQNAAIVYNLVRGNEEQLFTLDDQSGTVSLTKSVAAAPSEFELVVEALDGQGSRSANQAKVVISVKATIPTKSNLYHFRVREDVSPYSEIGKIDLPSGYQAAIVDSSYGDYFSLNPSTGEVRTEARLDHEVNPLVVLNIRLTNDLNEEWFLQAVIDIEDVNDNVPDFSSPLVILTVPEDFPVNGKVLYVCTATDADSGSNGNVSYRLRPNGASHFAIDPVSAEVRLVKNLDFESQAQHTVVVEASDSGTPVLQSVMKLNILVHDVNDNSPVFENSTYVSRLSDRNAPVGASILSVRATDRDQGKNGRITYQVSPNPYFRMTPSRGVLVLKRPLDPDVRDMLEVTVTAVDHGTPSLQSTARVQILVADRNRHAPRFPEASYALTVAENAPAGSVIGEVSAVDADGDAVEYHFRASVSPFVIEASSGRISTSRQLDREQRSEYELLVEAIDLGHPRRSSQTVVKVSVQDMNDETPMLDPASRVFYVSQLSTASSLVGRLVAVDPDVGDQVSFRLSSGSDTEPAARAAAPIRVDERTGDLYLTRNLQYDDKNFSVSLVLSDRANHLSQETVTVQVVSDDPSQMFSVLTQELHVDRADLQVGLQVGRLLPQENGSYLFFLESSPDPFPFYVDAETGTVHATDLPTPVGTYEADIHLESVRSDRFTAQLLKVTVQVVDRKQWLRAFDRQLPLAVSVPEDAQPGTPVTSLLPAAGQSAALSFSLVEQTPDDHAFTLDSQTGVLKLSKALDYEVADEYLVTIKVVDAQDPASRVSVVVSVAVQDVNDVEPRFLSRDQLHLQSNVALKVPVFQLIAWDADSEEVRYSILSGNEDGVFKLDSQTGVLTVERPLARTRYSLTVRAEDDGQLFTDQKLSVVVRQDEATALPKFLQSTFVANVTENAPPDTLVLRLAVINPLSEDILFTLFPGDDGDKFHVDSSTGEIRTKEPLDYEEKNEYTLVLGLASASAKDAAQVRIQVIDLNDNEPIFGQTCRDVSVPENSGNGSFVHAVVAYDADSGDNGRISYRLSQEAGGDDSGAFYLDPVTARLYSLQLDRELRDQYALTIVASDNGVHPMSASCHMKVSVMDVNDNEPRFSQSVYSTSVLEDTAPGTEVLRLLALDADIGVNADISYSISNASHMSFAIDQKTGSIVTVGHLDRETVDRYDFIVVARDGGREVQRSGSAKVSVVITDANDHTPELDEFPFRVNVSMAPAAGVPLLRISAHDPDLGANGKLLFHLLNAERNPAFDLTPEEGILSIVSGRSSSSDMWTQSSLILMEVSVSDSGQPPRSSTGLIEITVQGGPLTRLHFQQEVYYAEIAENPVAGADVLQVRAVRSDGRLQNVEYAFVQGNQHKAFEINGSNGMIRVREASVVDYERHKEFVLSISAKGLGDDHQLSAYAKCIVKVRNVNDNPPKFSQAVYQAAIKEGLEKHAPVAQVEAFDLDSDNKGFSYEIIDGNVDGAFTVRPSSPGLILTNTVLDREIRDRYELTVSATDRGQPSLSGTAQVVIQVIDVNDSPVQFSEMAPIRISKGVKPGALIATVRANDIDSSSMVRYSLLNDTVQEVALDTFTGQVFLLRRPAAWQKNPPLLVDIQCSDGLYSARQQLQLNYEQGAKDCAPSFDQPLYHVQLDPVSVAQLPRVVSVLSAMSCGSEQDVQYVVETSGDFFSMAANGSLILAKPLASNSSVVVVVAARDRRSKRISRAVVSLHLLHRTVEPLAFHNFPEGGITLQPGRLDAFRFSVQPHDDQALLVFGLTSNPWVRIDASTGQLFNLDTGAARDQDSMTLQASVRRVDQLPADAVVKDVKILNGNRLKGKRQHSVDVFFVNATLSPTSELNEKIGLCHPPGVAQYQLLSGNDDHLFSVDQLNSRLLLTKRLSHDAHPWMRLILKMKWDGDRSGLCIVHVQVGPRQEQGLTRQLPDLFFPISDLATSIKENSAVGTKVISLGAFLASSWNRTASVSFSSNTSSHFAVDATSGDVTVKAALDYESVSVHHLHVVAQSITDPAAPPVAAVCHLQILIQGVDEFAPAFLKNKYHFSLDPEANVGHLIGTVTATDADKGPDGQILYSLAQPHSYFSLSRAHGTLILSRPADQGIITEAMPELSNLRSIRDIRLVVEARSPRPDSLVSKASVYISLDVDALPVQSNHATASSSWIPGVIVGILVSLLAVALFVFFFCRFSRAKSDRHKDRKLCLSGSDPVLADQQMEMAGTAAAISRFPPQYSEIVSDFERSLKPHTPSGVAVTNANHSAGSCLTRSELSDKSASSGRGSVEEDEDADVEIRMINEGNYISPHASSSTMEHGNVCSFLNDPDDKMSDAGSVHNTEDYLARLGINIRKPPNVKGLEQSMSDHYSTGSIYNRILDETMSERSVKHGSSATAGGSGLYGDHMAGAGVRMGQLTSSQAQASLTGSLSSIVHSEEELAGSYNWDYLLDWGPSYQPLAHVFKEISQLKDDPDSAAAGQPSPALQCNISKNTSWRKHQPTLSSATAAHLATTASSVAAPPAPSSSVMRLSSRPPPAASRSPISPHDVLTLSALSPSFHPALSPLATKSPSASPLSSLQIKREQHHHQLSNI